jgi:hypothetical protein
MVKNPDLLMIAHCEWEKMVLMMQNLFMNLRTGFLFIALVKRSSGFPAGIVLGHWQNDIAVPQVGWETL